MLDAVDARIARIEEALPRLTGEEAARTRRDLESVRQVRAADMTALLEDIDQWEKRPLDRNLYVGTSAPF